MKTLREIVSVATAIILMAFISLSLARLVYFFLHSQNLL
jgi:hypothetical protein